MTLTKTDLLELMTDIEDLITQVELLKCHIRVTASDPDLRAYLDRADDALNCAFEIVDNDLSRSKEDS